MQLTTNPDDIRYMSYEQRIAEGYAVPGRKAQEKKPTVWIQHVSGKHRAHEVSEQEAETMCRTGRYERSSR